MSIRLFRTFVAIAETGSFAGAAEKAFVTQAAVSQQMKRLEDELQTVLFDRTGRTPRLTPAADALVPQVRDLIHRYDQLVASLRSNSVLTGDITIGAVPAVMSALVPRALKSLYESFPGVHIKVVPNLSSDLFEMVERGSVDAAVMSKPPKLLSRFRWHAIADEPIMLAVSEKVSGDDPKQILTNNPYLRMAQRAWVGDVANEILDELGLSPGEVMELESLETIGSMIAHNLGVAIIPKPVIANDAHQNIRFLPVGVKPRSRSIGVLCRSDNPSYSIIEAFGDALKADL
ncbi:MAG: LysR family transcriptional regulator [Pseudomonadota bacterium]